MFNLTKARRAKSPNKNLPVSWKRFQEYNDMLDRIYGSKCYLCQYDKRLELHHLWYVEGLHYSNSGYNNITRKIEAIQHPERFVRLCKVCHSAVTLVEQKGLSILDGISFIVKSSQNRTPIQEKIVDLYAK